MITVPAPGQDSLDGDPMSVRPIAQQSLTARTSLPASSLRHPLVLLVVGRVGPQHWRPDGGGGWGAGTLKPTPRSGHSTARLRPLTPGLRDPRVRGCPQGGRKLAEAHGDYFLGFTAEARGHASRQPRSISPQGRDPGVCCAMSCPQLSVTINKAETAEFHAVPLIAWKASLF